MQGSGEEICDDKLKSNSECRIQASGCASKCTQTHLIDIRRRYPLPLGAASRVNHEKSPRIHITHDTAGRSRTFIAPPVRGICRVMSGRRPLQVHRESNNYVFPLSSCLCVWSKHNVMAKRAAANHRAHPGAGIFSSQSALTRRQSGRSEPARKGACVSLTDASCYFHSFCLFE